MTSATPTRRLRWTHAPVVAALLVSALLVGSTALIYRGVRQASNLVARGQGQAFAVAAQESLASGWPLDDLALETFLEEHREEGLRFVAVLGEEGDLLASAGQP